jgi:twinkle protein
MERTLAEYGIVVPPNARPNSKGEVKVKCPRCCKGKHDYSLAYNVKLKVWKCWRESCAFVGSLYEKSNYITPTGNGLKDLNEFALEWLRKRGLTLEAIDRMGLKSVKYYSKRAERETEILAYPMLRYGKLTNVASRRLRFDPPMDADEEKAFNRFWFETDARLVLCNIDVLDREPEDLYWVEGWLDGCALESIGIWNWISIPAGSPKENTENFDGKLEPINLDYERLKKVKRHLLFLDNDGPGRAMTRALARRLDQKKCYLAKWPGEEWKVGEDKIKDVGDLLRVSGTDSLKKFCEEYEPYPLEGFYTRAEVLDAFLGAVERKPDALVGIPSVNRIWSFKLGYVHLMTGVPGTGKSTTMLDFIRRVCADKSWRASIFAAENMLDSLGSILVSQQANIRYDKLSQGERKDYADWFYNTFHVIKPDILNKIEPLLAKVEESIYQRGDRIFLLDPYNRLENERYSLKMGEIEYLCYVLNLCSAFAKRHGIIFIIVAHPSVTMNKDGSYALIKSFYKINGGAMWSNICDMVLTTNVTEERKARHGHLPARLDSLKIKEKPELGIVDTANDLWFNPETKRLIDSRELDEYAHRLFEMESVSYD